MLLKLQELLLERSNRQRERRRESGEKATAA